MLNRFTLLLVFAFSLSLNAQKTDHGSSPSDRFLYVENGRLYHPDGNEVAMWGVNIQPMLSWEYEGAIKARGIPKNIDSWKDIVDDALDELEILNCKVWRAHLTPADFTDANGNLVHTIYLDILDYTVAEAAKRGIYSYIAFLNHMGKSEVDASFMQSVYEQARQISKDDAKLYQRNLLMFDSGFKSKSLNFIQKLLERTNPYLEVQYKSDTSIAVWEIMNEPTYMNADQIKKFTGEYASYKLWLSENGLSENAASSYYSYRKMRVKNYINEVIDSIKSTGAKQAIAWNCNWHRMINGREDVFEAIAESKAEVVSFCNYPGQGVASQNGSYWNNPIDLTRYNFSSWYRDCYVNRDWYGWALEPRFAEKAKIVYEFETFFNQSAYLYPVMADFLRSVGTQMACMWRYSLPVYAQYNNGSHFLNLKCTPAKAASFVVASKIFENTPILQDYHSNSTTEWQDEHYMYSYKKNLSIYSSEDDYITSGSLTQEESLKPSADVRHILGYGSSPLVKYGGTGIYDIHISENQISIHIEPNSGWLRLPWGGDNIGGPVTTLDYEKSYAMEIRLDGWKGTDCNLIHLVDGVRVSEIFIGKGLRFAAQPGNYLIER